MSQGCRQHKFLKKKGRIQQRFGLISQFSILCNFFFIPVLRRAQNGLFEYDDKTFIVASFGVLLSTVLLYTLFW